MAEIPISHDNVKNLKTTQEDRGTIIHEIISGDKYKTPVLVSIIPASSNETEKIEEIEYACLLANCFPKSINNDAFNYSSGEHNLEELDIEFTCTKYESNQINKVAQALLNKYKILTNSL